MVFEPTSIAARGCLLGAGSERGEECPGGSVNGFGSSHVVPAGFYGLDPNALKSIDPLGIGPSRLVSDLFKKYPSPNDTGRDLR